MDAGVVPLRIAQDPHQGPHAIERKPFDATGDCLEVDVLVEVAQRFEEVHMRQIRTQRGAAAHPAAVPATWALGSARPSRARPSRRQHTWTRRLAREARTSYSAALLRGWPVTPAPRCLATARDRRWSRGRRRSARAR